MGFASSINGESKSSGATGCGKAVKGRGKGKVTKKQIWVIQGNKHWQIDTEVEGRRVQYMQMGRRESTLHWNLWKQLIWTREGKRRKKQKPLVCSWQHT